jgi:hypothetical protein
MNAREIRLIGKRIAMELPPSTRKVGLAILDVACQEVIGDQVLWPDREEEEGNSSDSSH